MTPETTKKKNITVAWSEAICKRDLVISFLISIPFLILIKIIWPVAMDNKPAFWEEHFKFDITVLETIRQMIPEVIGSILKVVYVVTGAHVTVFVVVGTIAFLFWKGYRKESAVLSFATLGIIVISDYIMKPFFFRLRPPDWLVSVHGRSFPSGHSAGNFVFYFFMAYLLSYYYPQYAKYIYIAATILVLSIGISSIYVRVHWFTDILAGYGLGFIWLTISLILLRLVEPKYLKFKPFSSNPKG